ncbi:MAG: zinc metallopeptidase [marine benthic group bacterium]|jgi:Zn-dependent membrane protease YugP|nr:zinc metallopeptidase [Gemmatimonadota bacterium]MCL7963451.1 zinc metallopeptidase [Candidatus Carthagonibacter metallireducens]MCL7958015.1 zinc metallopeptidase [Gemmatimonadota bacterium]MCL7966265.1 zinc metallopeptidase [Gemmatimonadota bacterium]MCL7970287.1 zinc metallopeptidase [Gemmatimonadota bacterium]
MGFYLIGGIAFLASMLVQWRLKSAYALWGKVRNSRNLTGAEVAAQILRSNGIHDVKVEPIAGTLTDHYDPRSKRVRLSEGNFAGTSVAALGVAAHEVGHAMQDAQGYAPMKIRAGLVPVANLGTSMGPYLAIGGMMLGMTGMVTLGLVLFAGAVLFQFVTLPVEFDASRRAITQLDSLGIVDPKEKAGATRVLKAAGLTYVAAAATSFTYLLYFILASRD